MRYRSRLPLVEAVRWTGGDRSGWPAWLRMAAGEPPGVPRHVRVDAEGNGQINAGIGETLVLPGQRIVRGRGRLVRCGTGEFEATSEPGD